MKGEMKILMLEDSPVDAEIIQRLLKKEFPHTRFSVVKDKEEFDRSLNQSLPDIILSDNSLPQFSALEALRVIRERKLTVPFIMVTGTMSDEFAANIIKSGADDYILKDRLIRLPAAIHAALQKRRAEQEKNVALQERMESEARYRIFLQRITDAFISLDRNWCYTYLNKQAGDLIRREPAEMIGKNVWDEFPEAVGSATYQAFHQAMKEQRYISNVDYYAPLNLWQENHIYPSADGISVFIQDITEKKKLELALIDQQRNEQLRMTAVTLAAQEKERNAIGRELHDNVNQILVGTSMMLSLLEKDNANYSDIVRMCMENIRNAIEENRTIAHELVAPDLQKENLLTQVNKLCSGMLQMGGITVEIDHSEYRDELLSQEQKLALYRIIQEQCTNITRYAKADAVRFFFSTADNQTLSMTISDNGVGMQEGAQPAGIGLQNINSRISVLGGTVAIKTAPGKGFTLHIRFPLVHTTG